MAAQPRIRRRGINVAWKIPFPDWKRVDMPLHQGDTDGEADGDGEWTTVATPKATYNLLELVNGVMEQLGLTNLPAGVYTQVRLYLGSTPDNTPNILRLHAEFCAPIRLNGNH
jgi:hypothetical protein